MSGRGFFFRVGAALVSPRRAALLLCQGAPGGLRDVLLLLPLRLVTGEAALFFSDDPRGLLLGILSALSIDLLAIFLGGLLMSLLIGKKEQLLPRGLTADLTAQGWLGWLGVQIAAALGFVCTQHQPGPALMRGIEGLAFLVWGAYWLVGFLAARQMARRLASEPDGAAKMTPPISASASARFRWAGGLFVVALFALSAYDTVFFAQRHSLHADAGRVAPEVVIRQIIGDAKTEGEFRLSAERGHPVLLDFFATWCGPCQQSLPILDKIHERLKSRGLRTIAIDSGEDAALVRAFANRLGLHLPIGLDTGEASARYNVTSIPHLILIGKDGAIKKVFRGVHSAEEIERAVLTLGF